MLSASACNTHIIVETQDGTPTLGYLNSPFYHSWVSIKIFAQGQNVECQAVDQLISQISTWPVQPLLREVNTDVDSWAIEVGILWLYFGSFVLLWTETVIFGNQVPKDLQVLFLGSTSYKKTISYVTAPSQTEKCASSSLVLVHTTHHCSLRLGLSGGCA